MTLLSAVLTLSHVSYVACTSEADLNLYSVGYSRTHPGVLLVRVDRDCSSQAERAVGVIRRWC